MRSRLFRYAALTSRRTVFGDGTLRWGHQQNIKVLEKSLFSLKSLETVFQGNQELKAFPENYFLNFFLKFL